MPPHVYMPSLLAGLQVTTGPHAGGACGRAQVKNSLRAVNDRYEDAEEEPPPVRVVVAEGAEDVCIKVHLLVHSGVWLLAVHLGHPPCFS